MIPTLSTLYGYLQSYAWKEVEEICENAPHLLQHTLPNGNTPLHEICSIGCAPNKLVEKIALLNPDAAMVSNKYGDLPLHIKCRNSQKSVFGCRLLLKVTPKEGLEMVNHLDHTPLATACLSGAWFPALYELIEANPQTLLYPNVHGLTPIDLLWSSFIKTVPGAYALHRYLDGDSDGTKDKEEKMGGVLERFWEKFCYAISVASSCQLQQFDSDYTTVSSNLLGHAIIQQNIKHSPQDLLHIALKNNSKLGYTVDHDQNTIVHLLAKKGNHSSLSTVINLSEGKGARMFNKDKRLPLHIALDDGISEKIGVWENKVKLLSSLNPDALNIPDPWNGLYAFMTAAVKGNTDMVWILLVENPAVIGHTMSG